MDGGVRFQSTRRAKRNGDWSFVFSSHDRIGGSYRIVNGVG